MLILQLSYTKNTLKKKWVNLNESAVLMIIIFCTNLTKITCLANPLEANTAFPGLENKRNQVK